MSLLPQERQTAELQGRVEDQYRQLLGAVERFNELLAPSVQQMSLEAQSSLRGQVLPEVEKDLGELRRSMQHMDLLLNRLRQGPEDRQERIRRQLQWEFRSVLGQQHQLGSWMKDLQVQGKEVLCSLGEVLSQQQNDLGKKLTHVNASQPLSEQELVGLEQYLSKQQQQREAQRLQIQDLRTLRRPEIQAAIRDWVGDGVNVVQTIDVPAQITRVEPFCHEKDATIFSFQRANEQGGESPVVSLLGNARLPEANLTTYQIGLIPEMIKHNQSVKNTNDPHRSFMLRRNSITQKREHSDAEQQKAFSSKRSRIQ
jgi:hypothetical protein